MYQRIGLVVIVVGLAVVLFLLPKQVLNTSEKDVTGEANRDKKPSEEKVHLNTSEENSQVLDSILSTLPKELNKEDRIKELETKLEGLVKQAKYSLAAQISEKILEERGEAKDYLRSGELFAEAGSFAVDETLQTSFLSKASNYLERADSLMPGNLDVKVALAEVKVMSENPMEGIFLLREVLQKEPKHRKAMYQMGMLSLQSGQYDKAVERFEEYTKIYGDDSKGWFFLALSYKELQMTEKAKTSFEKVKELDNDPEVQASVDNYLNDL